MHRVGLTFIENDPSKPAEILGPESKVQRADGSFLPPPSRHLATGVPQAGNGSAHGVRQPAEALCQEAGRDEGMAAFDRTKGWEADAHAPAGGASPRSVRGGATSCLEGSEERLRPFRKPGSMSQPRARARAPALAEWKCEARGTCREVSGSRNSAAFKALSGLCPIRNPICAAGLARPYPAGLPPV